MRSRTSGVELGGTVGFSVPVESPDADTLNEEFKIGCEFHSPVRVNHALFSAVGEDATVIVDGEYASDSIHHRGASRWEVRLGRLRLDEIHNIVVGISSGDLFGPREFGVGRGHDEFVEVIHEPIPSCVDEAYEFFEFRCHLYAPSFVSRENAGLAIRGVYATRTTVSNRAGNVHKS